MNLEVLKDLFHPDLIKKQQVCNFEYVALMSCYNQDQKNYYKNRYLKPLLEKYLVEGLTTGALKQ